MTVALTGVDIDAYKKELKEFGTATASASVREAHIGGMLEASFDIPAAILGIGEGDDVKTPGTKVLTYYATAKLQAKRFTYWMIVWNFLALCWIIGAWGFPFLNKALDERSLKIRDQLSEGEKRLAEAKAMHSAITAKLDNLEAESADIRNAAIRLGKHNAEQIGE
jgi:hypothetical protein